MEPEAGRLPARAAGKRARQGRANPPPGRAAARSRAGAEGALSAGPSLMNDTGPGLHTRCLGWPQGRCSPDRAGGLPSAGHGLSLRSRPRPAGSGGLRRTRQAGSSGTRAPELPLPGGGRSHRLHGAGGPPQGPVAATMKPTPRIRGGRGARPAMLGQGSSAITMMREAPPSPAPHSKHQSRGGLGGASQGRQPASCMAMASAIQGRQSSRPAASRGKPRAARGLGQASQATSSPPAGRSSPPPWAGPARLRRCRSRC